MRQQQCPAPGRTAAVHRAGRGFTDGRGASWLPAGRLPAAMSTLAPMKSIFRLLLMLLAVFAPDEYAQVAPAAFGPVVLRIQRADYEGDRDALQLLHDALAPVPAEAHAGSRVRYWRGFALWRRAI